MEQISQLLFHYAPILGLIVVSVSAEIAWPEQKPRGDGLVWLHVGVLYAIGQFILRLMPVLTLYGVALWRETLLPSWPGVADLP
ncbi:MAG: hypothetical protein AAFO75_12560, partial [Pseudomonadota bacterium]